MKFSPARSNRRFNAIGRDRASVDFGVSKMREGIVHSVGDTVDEGAHPHDSVDPWQLDYLLGSSQSV